MLLGESKEGEFALQNSVTYCERIWILVMCVFEVMGLKDWFRVHSGQRARTAICNHPHEGLQKTSQEGLCKECRGS